MADRVEAYDVTIAAGTLSSAPQTTVLAMPPGDVELIEVVVPDGCAGFVGFQIFYGGERIIPHTTDAFFIANNETVKFPIAGYPRGQAWRIRTYNEGIYEHVLHVRIHVNEIAKTTVPIVAPEFIG